jgi:hypothetical protein
MTKDELTELIQDIRNGRTEDDVTDWKRQFWELGVPESRKQILKGHRRHGELAEHRAHPANRRRRSTSPVASSPPVATQAGSVAAAGVETRAVAAGAVVAMAAAEPVATAPEEGVALSSRPEARPTSSRCFRAMVWAR